MQRYMHAAPSAHPNRLVSKLHYAVADHAMATVLCAVGADGLTAVLLGPDSSTVIRLLQERFASTSLTAGGAEAQDALQHVQRLMDGLPGEASPPLALLGSPFERLVWQALMAVPSGTTTTYGAIAAAIGRPGAARAVGAACSRNNLAVVVPCHRVGYAHGSRVHYRWGPHLKTRLLEVEAAHMADVSTPSVMRQVAD